MFHEFRTYFRWEMVTKMNKNEIEENVQSIIRGEIKEIDIKKEDFMEH